MKVRDIMTTDVATAPPDTTLEEIATMMKEQDVGSIPTVDGDELSGIITDRDIVVRCIAIGDDPSEVEVEQILSGQVHTVAPDDEVEQAARLMSRHQIRRLPVVEDGQLVGVVSIGDIAVKEDEDTAGDALEDISEGVKQSRSGSSQARSKKPSTSARSGGSARGREESPARGRNSGSTSARRGSQGISNRGSDEVTRQQRVNPQRAASGSSGRRRRAS